MHGGQRCSPTVLQCVRVFSLGGQTWAGSTTRARLGWFDPVVFWARHWEKWRMVFGIYSCPNANSVTRSDSPLSKRPHVPRVPTVVSLSLRARERISQSLTKQQPCMFFLQAATLNDAQGAQKAMPFSVSVPLLYVDRCTANASNWAKPPPSSGAQPSV